MKNKLKKVMSSSLAFIMMFSLCACGNNVTPVESPDVEPSDVIEEPIEPTPTPPVEESVPPTEEPAPSETPKEEETELEFSMTDNPPEAMAKIDAAKWLLNIIDESLTKSLSQQSYALVFSEVFDSNSLYGNTLYNYRAIDLTKDGNKIVFEGINNGKFYKGEFNQTPGNKVENLSAKNLITSRNIDALEDLEFENGINDIYMLFMNVLNLDDEDFYEIFKEHSELIQITYENTEEGNTKYILSIANPNNFIKTTNNKSASSYIEKNTRTYLENSRTDIEIIIDNNKLIQSMKIIDILSAGFYNQSYLSRTINFTYDNAGTYNPETESGNGELPVTIGVVPKVLNIGRVVKYSNPNSAETSGGVDNTRWEITYKKEADGSHKAIQLTAASNSNYNVNGITKGMAVENIKEKFSSTVFQDDDLLIGLIKCDQNIYTVIVYLDDGVASSISVKMNPVSETVYRCVDLPEVGSYIATITADENMKYFNSNKNTIVNAMFKVLTKSFSMKQTVEISGQNLGKYKNKVMGIEIHPELNYIYSSITGDKAVSESNTITRIGSFSSPATVLNIFIQNVPSFSMNALTKTEGEDGVISYSGEYAVNDTRFEDLVKLACGYPNNDIEEVINDVNAVAEPLSMYVDITEKDGLIQTLIIRLESKRDSVTYNLDIQYD